MNYVWSFVVGGILCVIGQILIERTRLTPARILVGYVVSGVILSAFGIYEKLISFAHSGASVPLSGFGHLLAEGVRTAVREKGRPLYELSRLCGRGARLLSRGLPQAFC